MTFLDKAAAVIFYATICCVPITLALVIVYAGWRAIGWGVLIPLVWIIAFAWAGMRMEGE